MSKLPASFKRLVVVLARPSHPGNVGATARAMLTMGLSRLVLVKPVNVTSGRGRDQAWAMAAHGVPVLEQMRIVDTLDEAVEGCGWVVGTSARPRHLGDEPLTPWGMAERALQVPWQKPTALVFGSERTGLTNDELAKCHATVRIASNPDCSSLNLAQAVQVLSYELRKAALPEVPKVATKKRHPWYAPPDAGDVERFYEHLEKVLRSTGFLDPNNPRVLMRRLRVLFGRASPDRNELNILRGILTSVEKPKRRTSRKRVR